MNGRECFHSLVAIFFTAPLVLLWVRGSVGVVFHATLTITQEQKPGKFSRDPWCRCEAPEVLPWSETINPQCPKCQKIIIFRQPALEEDNYHSETFVLEPEVDDLPEEYTCTRCGPRLVNSICRTCAPSKATSSPTKKG